MKEKTNNGSIGAIITKFPSVKEVEKILEDFNMNNMHFPNKKGVMINLGNDSLRVDFNNEAYLNEFISYVSFIKYENPHFKNLTIKKDRLFLITHGSKGAIVGKYDYTRGNMDFILQCFPSVMKMEDIVDLNGAGDAFLGGFLSQFMQGKNLEACCKAGNDAANVILKNIGCTFDKNKKLNFS